MPTTGALRSAGHEPLIPALLQGLQHRFALGVGRVALDAHLERGRGGSAAGADELRGRGERLGHRRGAPRLQRGALERPGRDRATWLTDGNQDMTISLK